MMMVGSGTVKKSAILPGVWASSQRFFMSLFIFVKWNPWHFVCLCHRSLHFHVQRWRSQIGIPNQRNQCNWNRVTLCLIIQIWNLLHFWTYHAFHSANTFGLKKCSGDWVVNAHLVILLGQVNPMFGFQRTVPELAGKVIPVWDAVIRPNIMLLVRQRRDVTVVPLWISDAFLVVKLVVSNWRN